MKDSLFKTISVAVGICLVCSVLVSTAAVVLKPYQVKNKELDKNRNILIAAGLIGPKEKVSASKLDELFASSIRPKVVNLEIGEIEADEDYTKIDERRAVGDPALRSKIDSKADLAGIKYRPNKTVIYECYEGEELKGIVFPFYGKGLWSTMYGFITLEPDYETVVGITYYEHGETPGLGGEIVNPKWQALWVGKKVYGEESAVPKIEVVRNGMVDPENEEYEIDGIAGSTLTCRGVNNSVHYWLGQNGFGPFIEKMKAGK